MPAQVQAQWRNSPQVARRYNSLSNELRTNIRNEMMQKSAESLKRGMRRRVHKVSGRLFQSIEVRITATGRAAIHALEYGLDEDFRGSSPARTNPPPHDYIRRTMREDGPRNLQESNRIMNRRIRQIYSKGGK